MAVEDDLTIELGRSGLDQSNDVVNLINRSAVGFRQSNFNGCLTDMRIALETLVGAIARTRDWSTSDTRWGSILAYLRTSGFLNEVEEKLINIFTFVSRGAHTHVGLSDAEMARLGRSLCTTMCYFLIKRYNT